MTCDEACVLVHAFIDGELDASHMREVETHASGCTRCSAEMTAARALRDALRGHSLSYRAPASLRQSIDRAMPRPATTSSRRTLLKGVAAGSLATAAAAAGFAFVLGLNASDSVILGEAVSAHLRSLQAEHLTDVQSTDRHTVKPWFNGRLDLAPPVIDLAAQGFTLIGGRLDYIDGKPVAALVYRRRAHVINLFVMPGSDRPLMPKLEALQGFNILRWSDQDLSLLAVSDLAREELEEFGAKFQAATRTENAG